MLHDARKNASLQPDRHHQRGGAGVNPGSSTRRAASPPSTSWGRIEEITFSHHADAEQCDTE
jgi:hypothetical protein